MHTSTHQSAFALTLATCLFVLPAIGAEPTIEDLAKGAQHLTTDNPKLTAFSFRMQMDAFEVPTEANLVWRKAGTAGMMLTAGDDRLPLCFFAGTVMMFFDIVAPAAVTFSNVNPKFKLSFKDRGGCNFEFGGGTGEHDKLDIDLGSLFATGDVRAGTVAQNESGKWVLTSRTSPRGNRTLAIFDAQAPYTLREIDVSPVSGKGPTQFRIVDLRYNDEVDATWPESPPQEKFPDGVQVISINAAADNEASSKISQRVPQCQFLHLAFLNPQLREDANAIAKDIDWKEVEVHAMRLREFGPLLLGVSDEHGKHNVKVVPLTRHD